MIQGVQSVAKDLEKKAADIFQRMKHTVVQNSESYITTWFVGIEMDHKLTDDL